MREQIQDIFVSIMTEEELCDISEWYYGYGDESGNFPFEAYQLESDNPFIKTVKQITNETPLSKSMKDLFSIELPTFDEFSMRPKASDVGDWLRLDDDESNAPKPQDDAEALNLFREAFFNLTAIRKEEDKTLPFIPIDRLKEHERVYSDEPYMEKLGKVMNRETVDEEDIMMEKMSQVCTLEDARKIAQQFSDADDFWESIK